MFVSFCVKKLLGDQKVAHDSFYVDPTQERNLIMTTFAAATRPLENRVLVVINAKGFIVGVYNNYKAAAAAVSAHPIHARISDEPILSSGPIKK
jgi:hypothetical protein